MVDNGFVYDIFSIDARYTMNYYMVFEEDDFIPSSGSWEYATIVGDGGYDGYTTEVNKLYFSFDNGSTLALYRCSLTLEVVQD